ncbi:MAG: phosphomethylpyrimidine synthase ThiC [Desulfuromonadia bacterium]
MTQIERARQGEITPEMEMIAGREGIEPDELRRRVADGTVVIPRNRNRRDVRPVGIGKGLSTKINASIGTSTDRIDYDAEVQKARIAEETGSDTLMELSVGGDLDRIRREVLDNVRLPVGNVPLYQAFCDAARRHGDPARLDPEELFDLIERQCEEGIDFMAIHCGINRATLERLRRQGYRYGGLVSKGGVSLVSWMMRNDRENPLYEQFDRVVSILRKHDVLLSLGNGLRAGAIHDSHDRAQTMELIFNCELAEIARESGCQAMVEGPGHVPLDEIEANIRLQKRMSGDAPYYMLGPIPTDVAPGLDHLTSAIGAAHSAWHGADLICYITPAEHLGLPTGDDVRIGVQFARVAAYIGDMAKYGHSRRERDRAISLARRSLDWEGQFAHSLYPDLARRIREERTPGDSPTCSMCGDFCASRGAEELFASWVSPSKRP